MEQARVERVQSQPAIARVVEHAGPIVLDQHIRIRRRRSKTSRARGLLQVQCHAALAGVVRQELRAIECALIAAERISLARLFELDDIRPEIRQQHARARSRDESAQFDDANIF